MKAPTRHVELFPPSEDLSSRLLGYHFVDMTIHRISSNIDLLVFGRFYAGLVLKNISLI